jgi:TRAP-type transport system periplasmic protein
MERRSFDCPSAASMRYQIKAAERSGSRTRVVGRITRRRLLYSLPALTIFPLPSLARKTTFVARQFHSQPPGSHLDIYLNRIWRIVREETAGALNVTVFPKNNGVIVGDTEVLAGLQAGSPEFFTINGDLLASVQPEADIQGIPFAFASSKQIASLNDGAFGDYLRSLLVAKDIYFIPFGSMENGFKQIVSVSSPIRRSDDLRGIRMRVPNGKLFREFYSTLGAIPVTVNFNRLYAALAAHEVDGQENPLSDIVDNRFYEVCKYVGMTSHQWAGYNMLASLRFWQKLPKDMQRIILQSTKRVVPEQRLFVQQQNASAVEELKDRGMIFSEVDGTSIRSALRSAGFYATWRRACGQKAWALMEAEVGAVD